VDLVAKLCVEFTWITRGLRQVLELRRSNADTTQSTARKGVNARSTLHLREVSRYIFLHREDVEVTWMKLCNAVNLRPTKHPRYPQDYVACNVDTMRTGPLSVIDVFST